jgi:hypothetical protein
LAIVIVLGVGAWVGRVVGLRVGEGSNQPPPKTPPDHPPRYPPLTCPADPPRAPPRRVCPSLSSPELLRTGVSCPRTLRRVLQGESQVRRRTHLLPSLVVAATLWESMAALAKTSRGTLISLRSPEKWQHRALQGELLFV